MRSDGLKRGRACRHACSHGKVDIAEVFSHAAGTLFVDEGVEALRKPPDDRGGAYLRNAREVVLEACGYPVDVVCVSLVARRFVLGVVFDAHHVGIIEGKRCCKEAW